MSEQITVTLPDGSSREYDRGHDAGRDRGVDRPGLAKAALAAKVDGEWIDLDRPLDHDVALSIVTPRCDDGREVLRHSTAHVMAAGGHATSSRARSTRSVPRSPTASTTTSSSRTARRSRDDDLARIEDEMREIVEADQRFVREELAYDDALAVFADQPYKHEIIEKVRPGTRPSEDAGEASRRRRGVSRVPQRRRRRRRLRRPVPRAARAVDRAARRVQADEGRGRVLARQREGPDAAAHLRHRVGVEEGARRAPAPARGSRAPRPPQARRRARPVLVPRGDRFGPRGVPPEGWLVRRIMEEYSRQRHEQPATSSSTRRTSPRRSCSRRRATSTGSPTGMFPPMELDGGTDVLPQADELPVPLLDLPQPHPFVPRAAAALLRVRHRVPLREVGRRARPHTACAA